MEFSRYITERVKKPSVAMDIILDIDGSVNKLVDRIGKYRLVIRNKINKIEKELSQYRRGGDTDKIKKLEDDITEYKKVDRWLDSNVAVMDTIKSYSKFK